MTATYLQKILPTRGTTEISFELWQDRVPGVEHIRVFGNLAYAYIPTQKRHKLVFQTEQTIFLDCDPGSKGHKIMNLKTDEVKKGSVAHFDEEKKADKSEKKTSNLGIS